MKYAKSTMFYLIASLFAVLAVAFAPMASAADLVHSFKADNGQVFTTDDIVSVAYASGSITIVHRNSSAFFYPDATGAVYAKVKAAADFNANYVKVPGEERYMKTVWITSQCYASQTYLSYTWNGGPLVFADGCQLHSLIQSKSN